MQELAADCVRIDRLLYFGRDFLCGLDPPVLKLKFMAPSLSEYVSVVDQSPNQQSTNAHSSNINDALVSSCHRLLLLVFFSYFESFVLEFGAATSFLMSLAHIGDGSLFIVHCNLLFFFLFSY